ncbi:MAG TPA: hypothetical protein PKC39_02125 [Ferruginibacter sp.]|nr:hypothetical protein [Ferruginibacter sp.]HMP19734.1 hypothetical protein [Ferruginibacter sp.]
MKLKFYCLSFLTILVFTSCQKDLDLFVPDPGQALHADTNWVAAGIDAPNIAVLKKSLQPAFFTDSIELNGATASMVTPSGLHGVFPSGCLTGPGSTSVWGRVNIKAALLTTRGDMLCMDRPTTTDEKLLAVAGAIFIQAEKDNHTLAVSADRDIYLNFPVNGNSAGIKLYYGDEKGPGNFEWERFSSDNYGSVNINNDSFNIKCKRTGWICPAAILEGSGEKTKVSVTLPPHYTNANTVAYLVFKNKLSIATLEPKLSDKKFRSMAVPVNEACTLVVISLQGNDYYLGFSSITTTGSGSGIQQVPVTPYKVAFSTLKTFLSAL